MKLRLDNPIWVAILFVAALAAAVRLSRVEAIHANVHTGISAMREPLVLQAKESLKTEPGEWSFAPNVPPPITRKEQRRVVVNWDIEETQAEIAPGVIYDDYWAFNGKVPGPLLRVREGDMVEVHLTNNIKSMRSHNIDFHFVSGPGGGAAALNVAPGQTAVLEARAMAPGLYMFHCASPDIPMHIANGMYGFVLVEPAEGLPKVDKEVYVVQSELYTTDANPGHQHFSMERGEKADPQYVVFNGAKGALLNDKAVHANLNQTIRMYVGNAGPNFISSFHVIGQIFDKVYREGDLLSAPAEDIQTTLIPAGGSAVVEITPKVPGTFLMVDHAIFRIHKGAAGSIVVDGQKNAETAEIFNPVTAANAPEMSADAHLGGGTPMPMDHSHTASAEHAAMPDMDHTAHLMPNNDAPQPGGAQEAIPTYGIPPASDPKQYAAAVANAAAQPRQEEEIKPATPGNTIAIMPGAGNYGSGTNAYGPDVMTVKRGTAVTFVNNDPGMVHNVFALDHSWQSTLLREGQSWTHVFSKPGVYKYSCVPHPWMQGTLIVK